MRNIALIALTVFGGFYAPLANAQSQGQQAAVSQTVYLSSETPASTVQVPLKIQAVLGQELADEQLAQVTGDNVIVWSLLLWA